MENQFPVISDSYCVPYLINLRINTEKGITYDANNVRHFYIKDKLFTLHKRRVLCDNQGNPIVTLYKKRMTLHGRCQVFRGYKSKDFSQLLFSVKRSAMIPSGMINLEVFLANNQRESACDFRVNVCRDKRSCTVYAGESPRIVATMENNGGFNVLVDPYVDYAFIVALLMIVSEMKHYFDEMVNLAARMTIALGSSMT
ncbi:protein LURP-one-related 15 isoform X1 [Glycine max]|uniref:protein LURP-one-related 15 isoform X1 n=1 Tax=Glycine max TaxID=3847 RepID=UPI001B35719C|nr:protein LURP-one-related 15-like isoform X1 [Glycine max]